MEVAQFDGGGGTAASDSKLVARWRPFKAAPTCISRGHGGEALCFVPPGFQPEWQVVSEFRCVFPDGIPAFRDPFTTVNATTVVTMKPMDGRYGFHRAMRAAPPNAQDEATGREPLLPPLLCSNDLFTPSNQSLNLLEPKDGFSFPSK